MGSRLPAGWIVLVQVFLGALLSLSGCSNDAMLAIGDLGAGTAPSRLKAVTPSPKRSPVSYRITGSCGQADLYLPGRGDPRAGIVLVPGAVQAGKDDPRLIAFATTWSRLGFAVLVPELTGYRDLRIDVHNVPEVVAAFQYLRERPELPPLSQVGIVAISYAAGPAVLAALDDSIRERVRFVLAIGGYYDLRSAVRYFTTGYFVDEGVERHIQPDEYGQLVMAKTAAAHLRDAKDVAIIDAMVEAKLSDPQAEIARLASNLGPEGLSVYRLATNRNPAAVPRLIAALPGEVLATVDALTLRGKDLTRLRAQVILVHGKSDTLVPYTESKALARALSPKQAHLFVLEHVLAHVELSIGSVLSKRFWSEDLPDAYRLYRAVRLLLAYREPLQIGPTSTAASVEAGARGAKTGEAE